MEKRKSIVIFGGSFNPPHNIHFLIANQVLKQYKEVEKIIFIPINSNYPKEGLLENKHRYNMLQKVIEKNNKFVISDLDMNSNESRLTINVLEEMQKEFRDKEIWVLMGSDNLKKVYKWYRSEDLLREYKILVMEREGDVIEDIINQNELLKRNRKNIKKLNQDIKSDLSSSFIRKQIESGKSIKELVPEEVYEYIEENGLYRK